MSTTVLAVANQKGGVGKTTTTINLATALADMGRRVLLIDCDPQANATSGLGIDKSTLTATSYDVFVLGRPMTEACIPTQIPTLDLVPSDISLAGSEIELVGLPRRERRIQYALETFKDSYDYVFLDCPPSLGMLTVNAVVASQGLLVPIQCEYFALEGLTMLTHTLELLRRELNPNLHLAGIVMTLFDARLQLAGDVVDEVRRQFPNETFLTVIPRNVRLSEAPSHGLPISRYDPTCRGTHAYAALAKELDLRMKGPAPSKPTKSSTKNPEAIPV